MKRIFYVRDDYDPVNDRDLFVMASTVEESISLWRDYYEADDTEFPVAVYNVPAPSMGLSRVLYWYKPDGITVAWSSVL